MVLPAAGKVTEQVIELLAIFEGEHKRQELQEKMGFSDREYFRSTYLQPALEQGLVEMTIPDKPKGSNQQYKLTEKGKAISKK